jgi:hypothetical protein
MSNRYLRSTGRQAAAMGVVWCQCCTVPPSRKQLRQAQQTERGTHFLPGYLASSRLAGHALISMYDLSWMSTCVLHECAQQAGASWRRGGLPGETAHLRVVAAHTKRVPQVRDERLDRHRHGPAAATCAALLA